MAKTAEDKVFQVIEQSVRLRDWNRYSLAQKLVTHLSPTDVVPIATAIAELAAVRYRAGDFQFAEDLRWLRIAQRISDVLHEEALDTI